MHFDKSICIHFLAPLNQTFILVHKTTLINKSLFILEFSLFKSESNQEGKALGFSLFCP